MCSPSLLADWKSTNEPSSTLATSLTTGLKQKLGRKPEELLPQTWAVSTGQHWLLPILIPFKLLNFKEEMQKLPHQLGTTGIQKGHSAITANNLNGGLSALCTNTAYLLCSEALLTLPISYCTQSLTKHSPVCLSSALAFKCSHFSKWDLASPSTSRDPKQRFRMSTLGGGGQSPVCQDACRSHKQTEA